MNAFAQTFRRVIRRGERASGLAQAPAEQWLQGLGSSPVEIAPDDAIIPYFQRAPGAVDLEGLELDSPALRELKAAGVRLVVPLVSQGELIGMLNLGPRLSDQDYSGDDRKLLDNLAAQAAPALRVGQLVREQEAQVRTRERIEQELHVAQLIQQNFLPKRPPALPGWRLSAFYRPAREVGGDFYDFIELDDGQIALVVGDVTDKGVPAALVMAATRSVLRAATQQLVAPGDVLRQVNESLVPDIPAKMFVTCLYGVLDPATGRLVYANAGHNLPYVHANGRVVELRATGMPLGLLPGMTYEEKEAYLSPGDGVLMHSDGVAEAHNVDHDMFGFPRLKDLVAQRPAGDELIDLLLDELERFTGPDWEQEDDITLVTVRRAAVSPPRTLARFTLPSEPGREREAIARIADAVGQLGLPARRLEQLKTAVGEATMNAMEHGSGYRRDVPVAIHVLADDTSIVVQIADQGGDQPIVQPESPNLEAKLAGEQTPRGWGLFLIKNLVDEMRTTTDGAVHTVELVLHLKGGTGGSDTV